MSSVACYLQNAIENFVNTVAMAARQIKKSGVKFDAIAVTGYSAATIGSAVAFALGKKIIVVRKESENRHSQNKVEGERNQTFIFVDDFVASGATLDRVIENTALINCTCVGMYSYNYSYRNSTHYKTDNNKVLNINNLVIYNAEFSETSARDLVYSGEDTNTRAYKYYEFLPRNSYSVRPDTKVQVEIRRSRKVKAVNPLPV